VFGIFAPDAERASRLKDFRINSMQLQKIIDRDQGELETFGQNTRKVFVDADFFICNDKKKEDLRRTISRFVDIIFDAVVHTPTKAESAMYKASSAAANSACMSRQVGAAIVSEGGELIAVGWNDVPRFGGGLYCEDDQSILDADKNAIVDKDHRCFATVHTPSL
jgi:deoxycytidylate deaminase